MKATIAPIALILGFLLITSSCSRKAQRIFDYDYGSKEYEAMMSGHANMRIFSHGVASGDPLQDQVIIWTRVNVDQESAKVKWVVSTDNHFTSIIKEGFVTTDASKDYTIKIDVKGLQAGRIYYYMFQYQNHSSSIGRTKTLAKNDINMVNLGVVSCSNYEFGYFNAYEGLANEDLDAILHLGDYIYEYAPNKYGDENFERKHLPAKELLTLSDYRTRYAQYRTDASLQKAHSRHPFIMIWDDHEIANNTYKDGAQNHQEDEGDFMTRKRAAKKAYYEWQPIRETKDSVLYRSFQFGDLVDLIMLDERYIGRNEPPESKEEAKLERSMLGDTQLNWFKNQLETSKAKWKVIGNQVIFAPCDLSKVRPERPINLDAWDGYAYERNHIVDFLNKSSVSNTIFVTGDTHSSWAFEVPSDINTYKIDGRSSAIEIGTPSVTSGNWDEGSTSEKATMAEQALLMSNPHLKYVNGRDHGYTLLSLSVDKVSARWYYTENMKEKSSKINLAKEFTIGSNQKFILDK